MPLAEERQPNLLARIFYQDFGCYMSDFIICLMFGSVGAVVAVYLIGIHFLPLYQIIILGFILCAMGNIFMGLMSGYGSVEAVIGEVIAGFIGSILPLTLVSLLLLLR
jgi:hypothetical protein